MKPSTKALLWLALAIALVGGVLFLALQPMPPDQTQIASQLEQARAAGERRDINGVMQIISENYHDSNIPSPVQLRFLLNKMMGNEDVQINQSIPVVSVQGDSATSVSHLHIVTVPDGRVVYDHDVTMQWKREDGAKFLVVPTKVWHVVSADYGGLGFD